LRLAPEVVVFLAAQFAIDAVHFGVLKLTGNGIVMNMDTYLFCVELKLQRFGQLLVENVLGVAHDWRINGASSLLLLQTAIVFCRI
jgi:hypothetical protein